MKPFLSLLAFITVMPITPIVLFMISLWSSI